MRSEIKLSPHYSVAGNVIEIWYGDEFIAQVTAMEGPGVKIISKYGLVAALPLEAPTKSMIATRGHVANVIEVQISSE